MQKVLSIIFVLTVTVAFLGCEQQVETAHVQQMKARNVEVKITLPVIVTSQVAYYAMSQKYAESFKELGFSYPKGNQYYSYFLGNDVLKGGLGPDKLPKDITINMPTNETFEIYAVANLDSDPDLDIWKIDQTRSITHLQTDRDTQ